MWDASDWDSCVQSPARGSHLTNTCASPRGPGEKDSLADRGHIATQGHQQACLATHSGSAPLSGLGGTLPSPTWEILSLSLRLLGRNPSHLPKCAKSLVCAMRLATHEIAWVSWNVLQGQTDWGFSPTSVTYWLFD